jgi:hypothetical protein
VVVWHNAVQPHDVNGDGRVTPLDALLVINLLNSHPAPVLVSDPPVPPTAYHDVNQDGRCTATDVLLVINELNARAANRASAAGEAQADVLADAAGYGQAAEGEGSAALQDIVWADEALEDYALAGAGLDGEWPDLLAEAGSAPRATRRR